jgi:hypothetical protein
MFIEDLLHLLVDSHNVNSSDKPILVSISQQVKKGTGLTDRQHALVKSKLLTYKDYFDIDIEPLLDNTRLTLRVINRDQTISVVSHGEMLGNDAAYEAYKEKWQWIKLRFPFSKKNIVAVEQISVDTKKQHYFHQRGTHEHYFRLTETNVFKVVNAFKEKKFDIDEQLIEWYNQIKTLKENDYSLYPGVLNFTVQNINDSGCELIEKEIGKIDKSNILKVIDRKRRYGIVNIDYNNIPAGLIGQIAFRSKTEITIDPESYNLNSVAEAVMHLDRFPLLVVIDKDEALSQISQVYDAFSYIVPSSKQTALFRVDNNGDYNVNDYIHDKSLNNWLDNDTEIVYICKNKIPKLLLRTEWKPSAALILTGTRSHTHLNYYINDCCDLIMVHDKESSLIGKAFKSYAFM